MATTRGAAKRAEALAAEKAALTLSSPPSTPAGVKNGPTFTPFDDADSAVMNKNAMISQIQTPTPSEPVTTKRKRTTKSEKIVESVKGDWDVLPHGLGRKGDLEDDIGDTASQSEVSLTKRPRRGKAVKSKDLKSTPADIKTEAFGDADFLKDIEGKLGRKEQEANVGTDDDEFKEENVEDEKPTKKRSPRKKETNSATDALGPVEKKQRKKKHPYGLTPGFSPFPDHAKPTKEDCYEVNRLLAELHGEVKAPEVIPPPSMEVTGCGEVPDLLDALLRTLLSAATTSKNSNMALQGLKNTFGLRTAGVGKGSINWEGVHEATLDKVIESIKSGGLAKAKGTNIKKILDVVYERNLARVNALTKEKETGETAQVLGAEHETQKQKDTELARFKDNMLTLDYLFELTTDEVMEELTKLPGIGVKTTSCVILFCMKRPSFAVDTHVWRHCKWLGWVPETATRDKTFSHCEVMIPDELKYPLHQLFIKHGKTCPRCKAGTGPGSEGWETAKCPIEHLVKRTGKMKDKTASPMKKSKGKKVESLTHDEEAEESDLTELDDLEDDE
ncbi:DNA glycosylase [Mollisia scopiformis]|uniref:DNA glycosylase n=1 Tax=Mollisia scopiformis TaxID=149040 RepID=A0A194XV23_MOLSC|nr:DNA glycosylase [Mollisia scopiformis]KUJ23557.1 DNA glycosylase [Mollisia scopiformis]